MANEVVSWHFIPPRAPNFGGLWEAGVKSFKFHFKHVIRTIHLDYENFMTIVTQIEAILNSRPISPLSSDPEDMQPLIPGNFLVGRPLTSIPEPDYCGIRDNRMSQYIGYAKF